MNESDIERLEITVLLEALFQRYGYDFRSYARASIERRVRQFLSVSHCPDVSTLMGRVLRDTELFSKLAQNFSIAVTEMFRDPFVYRAIREQVIPLLKTYPSLKIWHAGCATGEEVYSMAILLEEEGLLKRTTIFATDFNDSALERARAGIYSVEKIKNWTESYQKSGGRRSFSDYYHARYGQAALKSSLRDRITFANHNLASDSSFGEMHVVFCRNVLIYFNRDLQDRALGLFSESLVRGGFLCLGTKEDLQFTEVYDLYETADRPARIYRKRVAL